MNIKAGDSITIEHHKMTMWRRSAARDMTDGKTYKITGTTEKGELDIHHVMATQFSIHLVDDVGDSVVLHYPQRGVFKVE